MLLYALLHLSGYDLSLDDLRDFRQWDSKTPGHPEFGHTVGVEATTGPLGQGISNAVGMALGSRMTAARFNGKGSFDPVSHRIFVLASDGDMMEGISGEASSIAGHLRLGNLTVLYDDNRITIEGETKLTFSENVSQRYEAYGWHTQQVDGHDHEALARAIEAAQGESARPSLIACRTHIAHGSPNKQDTADSHGAPLGDEEIRATKERAGWPLEPTFHVPDEVKTFFAERAKHGASLRAVWDESFSAWRKEDADRAGEWDAIWERTIPADITDKLIEAAPDGDGATRGHSGVVLQAAAKHVPSLVGGSADLAPSNKSVIKDSPAVAPGEFFGRNLHFGIREHAMGAMINGMLYHGAFRPYGATFLVFADYMRPSIRLAALSKLPAIYVFTHDTIFVGEDGPTHEPIEHAFSLRVIPNVHVYRPADGFETALAWGAALERKDGPTALLLTRQKVPAIRREARGELADPRAPRGLSGGRGRPARRGRGGHRLGAAAGIGRAGESGRRGQADQRGVGTLPRAVPAAGRGLPQTALPGRGAQGHDRGRPDRPLDGADRHGRPQSRYRPLRCLGPGLGPGREIRNDGRPRHPPHPHLARRLRTQQRGHSAFSANTYRLGWFSGDPPVSVGPFEKRTAPFE